MIRCGIGREQQRVSRQVLGIADYREAATHPRHDQRVLASMGRADPVGPPVRHDERLRTRLGQRFGMTPERLGLGQPVVTAAHAGRVREAGVGFRRFRRLPLNGRSETSGRVVRDVFDAFAAAASTERQH